jgi:hypothetical protein
MNSTERKTLYIYLAVMLVFVILSRLYWIFGDDPIGLIVVFFFLAPIVSFVFAMLLGNAEKSWMFPLIAGMANVANYMCNSMWNIHFSFDEGTAWVFVFGFAPACLGIIARKLAKLFF